MEQQSEFLFVYGSLRVGFRDPAYEYLSKYFTFLGEAEVPGKFYFNGTVPVAVPSHDKNYISGDLYALNNIDELKWVIVQLDDYEGLNVMNGEIPLYKRENVPVIFQGRNVNAWIYWYNRSVNEMTALDAEEVSKYTRQQKKP